MTDSDVVLAAWKLPLIVAAIAVSIVAGSGIDFDGQGAHQLKGVAEEWELYRVTATPLSAV